MTGKNQGAGFVPCLFSLVKADFKCNTNRSVSGDPCIPFTNISRPAPLSFLFLIRKAIPFPIHYLQGGQHEY